MPLYFDILSWTLLALALLSVWFLSTPKLWGFLLALSLASRMMEGKLLLSGLFFIIVWTILFSFYRRNKRGALFLLVIAFSGGFIFHLFPGFIPTRITPHFKLSIEKSILGLFPLALLVPLARKLKEWQKVLKGLVFGCLGIALMSLLVLASGSLAFKCKLPTFALIRYTSNLLLVAIPEEAFYRGFVQRQIAHYFKNTKKGKAIALLLSSLIFTLAHIFWSPSLPILAFVFQAGLLYGGVYLLSQKIESAILCHFLLNFLHMSCFSYHAM